MRRRIAEKTDELIDRHRLHEHGAPVDLTPLNDEFLPLLRPLDDLGVPALAMPPVNGTPTADSPALVVLDESRSAQWRAIYYAHEIGHIICGHVGTLRTLDAGEWWHNRDEREAWQVAARLMIPLDAIAQGGGDADSGAGVADSASRSAGDSELSRLRSGAAGGRDRLPERR